MQRAAQPGPTASRYLAVIERSLFWLFVDSEVPAQSTIMALALPHPGDKLILVDGTSCTIIRVGPPPEGSHVIKGIVYATSSG